MPIEICARTFRAVRRASGLSLDHLARLSGVSRSTLSRIERATDVYRANSEQASKLAKAFGLQMTGLTKDGIGEVILAEGDYVPIKYEFFRLDSEAGRPHLKHVGTNLRKPGPDLLMVAMVGLAPGTLIVRAPDEG